MHKSIKGVKVTRRPWHNSTYTTRRYVVFVGDSLTQRCELHNFYQELPCVNYGISGDTLANYASHYDKVCLRSAKAIVFLMGINDIIFDDATADDLTGIYDELFGKMRKDFPEMPIIVQSVYPVSISYAERLHLPDNINFIIQEINNSLISLCEKHKIRYVNVYSALLKDGELNPDYAADRIHVNDRCYKVVSALVSEAVREELGKQKVLDIKLKGDYPANELSNLYPHRFEIDGVVCESMEGFLQSLKYRNRFKQRKICRLSGHEAKNAGAEKNSWKKTRKVYWCGRAYDRFSAQYRELIRRAYGELNKNEDFRKALASTYGFELDHSIGLESGKETILTKDEFICNLIRLRDEMRSKA